MEALSPDESDRPSPLLTADDRKIAPICVPTRFGWHVIGLANRPPAIARGLLRQHAKLFPLASRLVPRGTEPEYPSALEIGCRAS